MKLSNTVTYRCALAAGCVLCSTHALATEDFFAAATSGKFTVNERLRYENVDDDAFARRADALTLRSRIAYETAPFYGFTLLTEFENVTAVDDINEYQVPAPPTPSAKGYAVIADPEGSEFNRFQLRYRGISKLDLTLGRQYIMYDNQRWVGNVGFRQDDQTFDAFSAVYKGIDDFTFSYAYVNRVNGITPELDSNTSDNLFNISYNGFALGKFTVYSYNLENHENSLKNPAPFIDVNPGLRYITNDTVGLRFDGGYNLPTTVPLRALYRAEYAQQDAQIMDPKKGKPPSLKHSYEADYKLAELGVAWGFGQGSFTLTPLLGYEELGSDAGMYGLQTPYATKHAFNGWADQFLVTPKEGLVDKYLSLGFDLNTYAVKTLLQYHDYTSASDNIKSGAHLDLGTETSLQVIKTFGPRWSVGTKFALYNEADHLSDVTVSGKKDVSKVWAWVEYNF